MDRPSRRYFCLLSARIGYEARRRRANPIPYDLDTQFLDSLWTGRCAVLGAPLVWGKQGHHYNANLDRVVPDLGYVKGNVQFLSAIANQIKSNATADQVQQVADWMKSQRAAGQYVET